MAILDKNSLHPLYVDVDGTLLRTDLLMESIFALLRQNPWSLLRLPIWLLKGKAYLKHQVASRVHIDPVSLPYREDLLAFLKAESERGRKVYLATASHKKLVQPIADQLGFISGVLATDESGNLKGAAKADAIGQHAKGQSFAYVGNDSADLPVWARATEVIVAEPSVRVRQAMRRGLRAEHVFPGQGVPVSAYLRSMRLHQWLKNLLVFVPAFAANKYFILSSMKKVIAVFVAFGLIASATYLWNDLLDLGFDRKHRSKRFRPLASGELPIGHGLVLAVTLILFGFALAAVISPWVFLVLAGYVLLTLSYSFYFKVIVLVDVLVLAALYTVRVIAGAVAIPVVLSVWLLAFSIFLFFSLALVKRYTELLVMMDEGRTGTMGRGYFVSDGPFLQSMGVASGYISVLVIALYLDSSVALKYYATPEALWLVCPLMLYWISRLWIKAGRREMNDDPLVFSLKDRISWLVFLGIGATWALAHVKLWN
jgi:4-hydroxybenzoate polyprenyltransferase